MLDAAVALSDPEVVEFVDRIAIVGIPDEAHDVSAGMIWTELIIAHAHSARHRRAGPA